MAIFKLKPQLSKETPVVFVHGGPGANSGLFMGALLRHGSENFQRRIVLHDQPGCGFDTDICGDYSFETLCDHLRLDLEPFAEIHLLAESFGCTPALEFASRYPEKIRSLTLVGPHFDRGQAQKNIFQKSSLIAQDIIEALQGDSVHAGLLGRFIQCRKEKLLYRESTSKKSSLTKDLVPREWSLEKKISFENEFQSSLEKNVLSKLLRELLIEIFERDLSIFKMSTDNESSVSTETLKGIAKRYDLFFVSSLTFDEVKNCREAALSFSGSPYSEVLFDRSNKKLAADFETATDWEICSRWPLMNNIVLQGMKVNLITGSHDPFATRYEFASVWDKYRNFRAYVLDHVGHSPIYEEPKKMFQILESVIYE